MLAACGVSSLEELTESIVPKYLAVPTPLKHGENIVEEAITESEALAKIQEIMQKNTGVSFKNYIGAGYYGTIVPPVIRRNLLENPKWYTSYTPYQAEISQGRLESLLNFQTVITELTGMHVSNASLLDESISAGEALYMCLNTVTLPEKDQVPLFVISKDAFRQSIDVVRTKARYLGVEVREEDLDSLDLDALAPRLIGVYAQGPDNRGVVKDYSELFARVHSRTKAKTVLASDLLALTLFKNAAQQQADICLGSSQRFGVPMFFGGPHAAFLATTEELQRKMPGRIIGISKDAQGNLAYRMTMQTREQHIRRDKATSNICTAQALLANIAANYAVYHGPDGLTRIAERVRGLAVVLADSLQQMNVEVASRDSFFDTVCFKAKDAKKLSEELYKSKINVRVVNDSEISVSFDETTSITDTQDLIRALAQAGLGNATPNFQATRPIPASLQRKDQFMKQDIFNSIRTEHEMLRYLTYLERKDISLANSMIPLGSCTMKLNAAAEMYPLGMAEMMNIHPFCPPEQAAGYLEMISSLDQWLRASTSFDAFSFQPNSGAQGEYAGLLTIIAYQKAQGQCQRNVALVPVSAHGTNPASAVLAGLKVVQIKVEPSGRIDLKDLKEKCEAHKEHLSVFMVTYPSTYGVYEDTIIDAIDLVHQNGGQVYMDGANLNAQIGVTSPGFLGADVCHLNLHKTFAIPHGGGGPGMGPIGVKKHLVPYLPGHFSNGSLTSQSCGTIAAAPFGSASILSISYMYIALLGKEGLKKSTQVAMLNANYMKEKLKDHFPVLFGARFAGDRVAHEFILDIRTIKKDSGISEEDVAKRLMDFGFHAPTMSFPVAGTLMIEPTESEAKEELDRLCEALIQIKREIEKVQRGEYDKLDNPLKNAPHTCDVVTADNWNRKYTREEAAYPLNWVRIRGKVWPTVSRIDGAYGDRNLVLKVQQNNSYLSL